MRYPVSATGSKKDFEKDWYLAQGHGNHTSYGFHDGADINKRTGGNTDLGEEVKAIAKGKIIYYHKSHPSTGFGLHLVYEIKGPWGTRWVHCCHLLDNGFIGEQKEIEEGQIIGRVGNSGTSTAHLHFAMFKVDPGTFGIDNIPNTKDELDRYWEDPIKFIDTWISQPSPTPPPPITDQSKFDFGQPWGIMEMQQARSTLNDQASQIKDLKGRLDQIRNLTSY